MAVLDYYFDITNPDVSYEWLHTVLDIKKGDLVSEYILDCNNDFDIFFEKHVLEIKNMDIKQLELVVIHVTTNNDNCAEIKKNGLRDLKKVLQEENELNTFLSEHGVQFDIATKRMYINDVDYDIDYEKYKDWDRGVKRENVLYKIGHKIYYDFQVNGFFFCQDIYDYGTIHKAPEFLFTLSDFNEVTKGIDDKWEKVSKPYVVKFKAKIVDFEYYTFYERETDYLQDYHNNWIELKKWIFSRAVSSAFSDSASQIFAYMRPGIIKPDQILECIPADEWRNDAFRYYK